ncbi:MAG: DNA polymerase III DnaE, DNA polymerase III subunit alpha [Parcubacteria group bacterium GW2011_GWC1_45_14]|nr:MAG: DNA polymerase III DnaE, DNA polymerase III subunit alpha [Parcubacteria group bacterium GW2011_GWC1_45_14]
MNTPKYTHLHVHSHYSLLDGLGKIPDLMDRAKELGMDSIALTDHGVLYGAIDLFITAKEKGIKPILGCEMYVTPNDLHSKNPTAEDRKRYHLILLVKNEKGYKNLMKLVSIAHLEGFYYKPRIDRKILRQYGEGLVGLSACAEGEIPAQIVMGNYDKAKELALEYMDIFDEGSFFLEVQSHPNFPNQKIANDGIFKLSKELNIPVVATCDVHYVKKEDATAQDILLCVQTNRKVQETDRMNLMDFDLSLRSPEEVLSSFPDHPEVLENTQKVVELCDFHLKLGETQLPHFEVPEGFTDVTYLRHLTKEGLEKRYKGQHTNVHEERMDYELSVIEKCGYSSYFLIVQDFVNWAKENGIVVGPGRGSAAGSFVSYLVGITNVDPIQYDLLFERFLNPERVSMPDVDMDFADDRRDDVLAYVRKKYGDDHVAQIITFGTMAARAAIRDTGRALGLPYDFCDKTSKMIPMFTSIKKALEEVPEFKTHYESGEDAKKLINNAMRLEGVSRHAGMHACGVVITKEPVTEYTPIQNITGAREGTVTQYSSSTKTSYVEKIGLLKMDFLGLKNLTIIQNAIRIIKKTKGVEINIDELPVDDELAYKLFQDGKTTGVFQFESSGMKRYLKLLKPTVIEDIIAMVALYRPGPMDWIPDFISGKHGTRKVSYVHPKLEPILKNTYGVAVYQEQVMQIARALAGFSMGEADVLRKAMGKKILDLIQEQKIKFVEGCVKNGVSKEIGEKVFSFIEPFAGYGFNRSHAACYALIGYQTAYLKAHYPEAFMAALLTSDQDNIDRIAIEVDETRDMGIEVLPPDVNESFENFAVILGDDGKNRIRFGLNAIKNVGHVVAEEIVKERKANGKFKSLADLVERVQTKDLNKKSIEALAKVGALDDLGERKQIIENIENIISFSKNIQKNKDSNQVSLFGAEILESPTIQMTECEPSTKKERLKWEKELLGLYVTDHPVAEFQDFLDEAATPIASLSKEMVGQRIKVGGVIQKVQKILTKRHETMLFVTLEDTKGRIELLVFPRVLEKTQSAWEEERMIIAEGRLSDKDGSFKLIADEANELNRHEVDEFMRIRLTQKTYHQENKNDDDQTPPPAPSTDQPSQNHTAPTGSLLIKLPHNATPEIIHRLGKFFKDCKSGDTKVVLHHNETKLQTPFSIEHTDEIIEELKSIVLHGSVELA